MGSKGGHLDRNNSAMPSLCDMYTYIDWYKQQRGPRLPLDEVQHPIQFLSMPLDGHIYRV